MTISGMEAWVTSAVEDKNVSKAIVLAGSLRRVRTAKKLAVLTTLAVSRDLREKLKDVFDLVVLLEQESPNGLNLEDYAKVQGFSLLVFSKCVYLSPNTLALKNCDEIFEKYTHFAAFGNEKAVDSTVYMFTPSLRYSRALGKIAHYVEEGAGDGNVAGNFSKYFNLWMENHIANFEKLDEQYNTVLNLTNGNSKSLSSNVTIANFGLSHPLDFAKDDKLEELGAIEKFAVDLFKKIYAEDVKSKPTLYSDVIFKTETFKTEPIAVVGMSFRLPGGNNADEFWDLLINGKDAVKFLPSSRWSREHTQHPCQNRKVEAGFLDIAVDEFDAKFFGISPKEAEFLDPQQRLLHEVAWEALEDAMIDPHKLRSTQTGIFVGSWLNDYRDMVSHTTDVDFFRVYMGTSIAASSARLSHFLETTGPSIGTESGCSSSMVAVDMACKSLRNHDSSLALACGVNLLLNPFDHKSLSFDLSPDGRCKTFDKNANGFGRAEGCAVLLMKRFSDAVRDGNNIWGLIRGSAIAQEGMSEKLGVPTVDCESMAMELALKDANVKPKDVSYVEAHGTGTQVGDPIEVAAIAQAYSEDRSEPLIIGSVKTNVGHTESVSGITGIIKVLLSMKNEQIPQHLHLETVNPEIDLDSIPAKIPTQTIPWPKRLDKPRIAGVSSFGISGTDGHAIIQEAPVISLPKIENDDERPLHIMKISAKSAESFEEMLAKYENIMTSKEDDEEGFPDLAYSANTGRATFNHRAVIVAKDFKHAAKIIKTKAYKHGEVQSSGNQICFLFTGQGSQYPNMAATLYATSPIFRDHFDKCDEVLAKRYGINMRKVLWDKSSDGTELSRTLYSQTSIFCVEYCLLRLWESWGVKPDYVMGHSLGEFAAAVAAGALDFEDALMLVAERSRLIDSLPRGKMLVIKADKKTVDQNINSYKEVNPKFWVDYAALNSSDQTVVAGDATMIEDFAKYCGDKSLKTIVLAATHAFHSRHMNPMLEAYRKVAATVKTLEVEENAPKYISGMEGKLLEATSIDADYWVRHTREKVSFMDACKVAQTEGCSLFLEVGPHPVLSALAMMNIEGQSITCLPSMRRKEEEWVTMLDSLTKLYLSDWKGEINWHGFDRYYKRSRVPLPFYPFNRKSIWKELESHLPIVHPLLGRVAPTASGETIFENRLTLKNASYTQDHVIGATRIFPGAGFLEMCLAGGHATVQSACDDLMKPRRPVVLKSLKIALPLALNDSGICRVQTITVLDDNDENEMGYNVGVHRYIPSGQWVAHASAKFLPVAPTFTNEQSAPIDIGMIQQTWRKHDNKSYYERLPELGLRFGPQFQGLGMGWKSENGMLTTVAVPEDHDNYLIHPVLADAMIQATLLWTNKGNLSKTLLMPAHIGEFTWLQTSESGSRFIYCTTNQDGNTDCILVDENGTRLAHMKDVEFTETSVKQVEELVQKKTTKPEQ